MNTKEKKIAKLIWQIHWTVNIAPNFNGVTTQPIKPYKIREERTNLPTGKGDWFTICVHTIIGWRKYGKAPYSINLVRERQRLIDRYNAIKNNYPVS